MPDLNVRIEGRAGRISLNRPKALNAMTYDMCMAIDTVLRLWREEERVSLVVIDAEGDKAFCAGGDIAELYETGTNSNFAYGRTFWRDEYRMNAMLAEYPKPVISLMQGFTMGGGVGIGCHGSHRVVDDSSRIAMPECGIGLVPDVGGSYLLARAPGHLGKYLGTTAARMTASDAIYAGFADHYVPRARWADLIELLEASGDTAHVLRMAQTPPQGTLHSHQEEIGRLFSASALSGVLTEIRRSESGFAKDTLKAILRNAPLSAACSVEIVRRLQDGELSVRAALDLEYRFTWRAMEHGDFLEGIRAAIIDKDRCPRWQFSDMTVPADSVDMMLSPLGADAITFQD